MGMVFYILGAVGILLLYFFSTYNSFIRLRNSVKEGFATMDVYLKKRWDLLPNLLEIVKGYMRHESDVLKSIVELRSLSYDKISQGDKMEMHEKLSTGIAKLMVVAENHPDLKASKNFLDFSAQLSKVEEDIANARKYYNAVVKRLNTQVEMFPSNLVAKMFGFKPAPLFEAKALERETIQVKLP